jgi:hypothetical protein
LGPGLRGAVGRATDHRQDARACVTGHPQRYAHLASDPVKAAAAAVADKIAAAKTGPKVGDGSRVRANPPRRPIGDLRRLPSLSPLPHE